MSTTLDQVTELVKSLLTAEDDVEAAEDELKRRKEFARVIREETLPGVMQELNLAEYKLDTGEKVKIAQEVYCSIPKDQKDAAFQWLEENDFGGLIKIDLTINYAKGEADKAAELCEELQEKGLCPSLEQTVHAQTLKAFLKEQIGKGANIPLDLFGARPVWVAKISTK